MQQFFIVGCTLQKKLPIRPSGMTPNVQDKKGTPLKVRMTYSVLSLVLFVYGIIGLALDDYYLPCRRRFGLHFHGISAWFLFIAFLSLIVHMMSVVVGYYDSKNEIIYRKMRFVAKIIAILSYILAILFVWITMI